MMSFLASDYFRQSPLLAMPVIALVIFMVVFVLVSARAFFMHRARWDALAQLPLRDGAETQTEAGHE